MAETKEKVKRVFPHPKFETRDTVYMSVNETKNYKATIYGQDNVIIDAPILYKSDNPDIVTIDDEGNVTALKEGYGEVVAFGKGKVARLSIEVVSVKRGVKGFTAHRGVRTMAPENTMEAFKKAVELKFDYIETDIQVTKDKKLVLFHDNTLKRMCGLEDKTIGDYTLEELRNIKFTSGSHLDEYPDVTIPTFEEYLELIASSDSSPMIELKDPSLSKENKDQLPIIKALISKYNLASKARVTSATLENILAYEEINEESKLAYIIDEEGFTDIDLLKKHNFLFSIRLEKTSKEFLQEVSDAGLESDVWLVNDKLKAKELLDWPITSMTSDIVLFDR